MTTAALAGAVLQLGGAGPATARVGAFSAVAEARKMDAVPAPALDWWSCYGGADCAAVKVPLDYDRPTGAKVELSLVRVRARDPQRRIGSLFVNPGGPGGSAAGLALNAPYVYSADILDRFDIVGMEPRGVGVSQNVECFDGARQQMPVLDAYDAYFPTTPAEEAAWTAANRANGKACTNRGGLALSMSTAEVARDMELMRRSVGDSRLSYFGWSYGSYLGQVYANMFPDRFRALAVDGVLDPQRWAGTRANAGAPLGDRLLAADGAWQALRKILVACDRAGGARCSFALGDPVANLDVIAERLKTAPLTETDPFTGETFTYRYSDLVGDLFSYLYDQAGYAYIIETLAALQLLTEPPAQQRTAAARSTAVQSLVEVRRQTETLREHPRAGFPYDNDFDAFAAVSCTDSVEGTRAADYPARAARADGRAPYFGRLVTWNWSSCAADAFRGNDEDAYRGPFTTRTAAPVLVVGNYWDPITNYQGAVTSARLLPNSRLLSSDSWGHTAYGSSACATQAVDTYLLTGEVAASYPVCRGDLQPFESDPFEVESVQHQQAQLRQRLAQPLEASSGRSPALR
ncbi:alpha/beta hydrolase [Friedmanniella luteola]|uniref:alpha/beta hydrolase n=1 Tax=Friedmanniella luteola TaxID=546871 RepID=UPI0018D441D9|nr:alpha/beta hydrolase [Friedmanniella luteola]